MCEKEEVKYGFPIRVITISFGANEDGGGLNIEVRMDGEDPEKIKEITFELLEKLSAIQRRDEDDGRNGYA